LTTLLAELAEILRCPACRGPLDVREREGLCRNCGRSFPSQRGVLRFVDASTYADSFAFQWKQYPKTQLDDVTIHCSEEIFRQKTGFTPDELSGKLVLDVGCGMGRFAEVATRWGARVVGVDLSAAAEVATENLAGRDFVALQADVFALPFAPERFDYIYSIGVLHHTPDCEKAFRELPQYLKPGCNLAIWVYSDHNRWYRFSDQYRKITHRLHPRTLHRVVRSAVPVLHSVKETLQAVPWAGQPLAGAVQYVFPISQDSGPEMRILDTFDWYSPQYQSKHSFAEVVRWFEVCGLENVESLPVPVAVRGRKPKQLLVQDESSDEQMVGTDRKR